MKNEDKVRVTKITVDYSDDTKRIGEIGGDKVHCEYFRAPLVLLNAGEMSLMDFDSQLHLELAYQGARAVPSSITNQALRPAKDAPVELRVADALCQDGFAATYEYPGYVEVHYGKIAYAFGTVNDLWGGHEIDKNGEVVSGDEWVSTVESKRTDSHAVSQVVHEIKRFLGA